MSSKEPESQEQLTVWGSLKYLAKAMVKGYPEEVKWATEMEPASSELRVRKYAFAVGSIIYLSLGIGGMYYTAADESNRIKEEIRVDAFRVEEDEKIALEGLLLAFEGLILAHGGAAAATAQAFDRRQNQASQAGTENQPLQ
jgi:hypothetical protein